MTTYKSHATDNSFVIVFEYSKTTPILREKIAADAGDILCFSGRSMTISKRTIHLYLYPQKPRGTARISEETHHPKSFLDFLEVHCGIAPAETNQLERTVAMMNVLRSCEGSFPTFMDSWEIDPFAVAGRLLEWMDEWYLAGWDGSELSVEYGRLRELSDIFAAASDTMALAEGLRLQQLTERFKQGVQPPLSTLIIHSDEQEWPKKWREVFSLISGNVAYTPKKIGSASPSVKILEFDSLLSASRYVAGKIKNDNRNAAVLTEEDSPIIDEVISASGLPRSGCGQRRRNFPAEQLLPLALRLIKEPLEMDDLLNFLSLPVSPLGNERYMLAAELANNAGLESTQIRESIGDWIPESPHPDTALPVNEILQVCTRVRKFLISISPGQRGSALTMVDTFSTMVELLSSWSTLSMNIIDGMLKSLFKGSVAGADAEAGVRRIFTSTQQMTDSVERLWYISPKSADTTRRYPWSAQEMHILNQAGCSFIPQSVLDTQYTNSVERIIRGVTDELILLVPRRRTELSSAQMIVRYTGGFAAINTYHLERIILTTDGDVEVARLSLPARSSHWSVPVDVGLKGDDTYDGYSSYSSIQKLINRPAQWVLEKRAKLNPGGVLRIPDITTFRGTCAHAMVEKLVMKFRAGSTDLSRDEFSEWYELNFTRVLEDYGRPLLSKYATRIRVKFKDELKESIWTLLGILRNSRVCHIASEMELEGVIRNIRFFGSADLVVQKSDGSYAVVDMKYSSWNGYAHKIEAGSDIQLAIYTELVMQRNEDDSTRNIVPAAGYWLFPRRELLTAGRDFFSDAHVVETNGNHESRISMLEKSIAWRQRQLTDGYVEIVSESISAEESKLPPQLQRPDDAFPREEAKDSFDAFINLYGWENQ